jgi:NADH-quinone oxidoreductase subunit H
VPFDIPEAETEIVAGALTEFSGRKLAIFRLALDMEMVVGCALLGNLFLGGFDSLLLPSVVAFVLKTMLVLFALSCIRALFARLRLDQMVRLSWGVLAPLSLAQLMAVVVMRGI